MHWLFFHIAAGFHFSPFLWLILLSHFNSFSVLGRWVGDQFLVGCFLATFQTPCFDSLSLVSLTSCLRFQRQGNRCFRSLAWKRDSFFFNAMWEAVPVGSNPLIPFLLIGVRLTSFPLFYKSSSPVLSVTSPLARTTTAPEVVSSRARTSFGHRARTRLAILTTSGTVVFPFSDTDWFLRSASRRFILVLFRFLFGKLIG